MGEFEKSLKLEGLRGILRRIEIDYSAFPYATLVLYNDGSGRLINETEDSCGGTTTVELFSFDTLVQLFERFGG